jgi:hypothetical protein
VARGPLVRRELVMPSSYDWSRFGSPLPLFAVTSSSVMGLLPSCSASSVGHLCANRHYAAGPCDVGTALKAAPSAGRRRPAGPRSGAAPRSGRIGRHVGGGPDRLALSPAGASPFFFSLGTTGAPKGTSRRFQLAAAATRPGQTEEKESRLGRLAWAQLATGVTRSANAFADGWPRRHRNTSNGGGGGK